VTIGTLNRQCSSGLQAVANVAAAIKAGYIDIGIGAGFESMTKVGPGGPCMPVTRQGQCPPTIGTELCGGGAGVQNSNSRSRPSELSADILATPAAADCLLPMGITSENVAERFGGAWRVAAQDAYIASLTLPRALFLRASGRQWIAPRRTS